MHRFVAGVLVVAGLGVASVATAASLCKECIQRPVRAKYPAMRRCYDALLGRKPRVAGRVVVRFSIEPSGETTGVVVMRNDLKDARFAGCIEGVFRTIHYQTPPPDAVRIHYPLRFEP